MTKTLLAPSLLIAAGSLCAGDNLDLKPWAYFQTRAEMSRGTADGGKTDYTPSTDGTSNHDTVDFYMRRARIGMKIGGGSWKGSIGFSSDNAQRTGDNSSAGRATSLYEAYVGYIFTQDESVKHEVRAGLYRIGFNPTEGNGSSSLMFAAAAATEGLQELRDIAVGYYLTTPMVNFNLDIGNSKNDGTAGQGTAGTPAPTGADQKGDGLWKSFRLQFNGMEIGDFKPTTKWMDSYAGAEGQNFAVAFEALHSNEQAGSDANPDRLTITQFGLDAMLHMDALTAVAEYRVQKTKTDRSIGTDPKDAVRMVWRLQAGYAFDMTGVMGDGWGDGTFIEPCARFQSINFENLKGNFGTGRDWAQVSGREYDVGVNWYFNGHKNKLSFLMTKWSAKEGDADATIYRLQHQINF